MRYIKSLFHVNFPTNKFYEMIDFYVNVCGCDQAFVIYTSDMKKMFGKPVEEGDDMLPQITYLRVSPNSYIELVNLAARGGVVAKNNPGCSFHHIAFVTNDIERTAKKLAAEGYPLFKDPLDQTPISLDPLEVHEGEDDCLIAWMKDPDGHLIEVMQQSGHSMQEIFEKNNPIT